MYRLSSLNWGMVNFLKKRWVYHSLIWISIYAVFVLLGYLTIGEDESIMDLFKLSLLFNIPIMPVTYLAFWAKETFFDTRRYLLYFVSSFTIVVIGVFIFEFIEPFLGEGNTLRAQIIANFIFFQLFALGLQYFKRGIINQYQLQELKAKTTMTELNALKAQLNPHFLFNTLNNIYGVNQIDSEKGSEMIMELSDVMRYHLEFSKEGKVKLKDEIQLLHSYIKLEKLRLTNSCDVKVNLEDIDEDLMISPLLFLPFVENAFKHGTHPNQKCFVDIEIKTIEEHLYFKTKNSIINNRKVVKTNIGLHNTKRRLELLFPQNHTLNITNNGQEFLVEIQLTL